MHNPVFWREKLAPYTVKSNAIGTRQVLLTLIPFMLLWAGYVATVEYSYWVFVPFCIAISLFILRFFVLMHDCGHGSLFENKRANQVVGFFLGVITGMPQFVWSKNHAHHHATNGDWVKYGGVFNIITTEKFAQLTPKQQRNYWLFRQPLILIPAGLFYVLVNPRVNWLLGNILMIGKILKPALRFNFSEAAATARKWECKYWKGKRDYWHMTYNNVVLISIWILMSQLIGTAEFFLLYVTSTSLAGSIGILVFTIQHNFEDSYATDTARVNPYRAALEGTSMLVLPKIFNWFTADIAYHHIHHISVAVPNYQLEACHKALEPLFTGVRRIYLSEVFSTFDYQLWDAEKEMVVARNTPHEPTMHTVEAYPNLTNTPPQMSPSL